MKSNPINTSPSGLQDKDLICDYSSMEQSLEKMKEGLAWSCVEFGNFAKSVTLKSLAAQGKKYENGNKDENARLDDMWDQLNYIKNLVGIVKLFPVEIANEVTVKLVESCRKLLIGLFDVQTVLYQRQLLEGDERDKKAVQFVLLQPVTSLLYDCLDNLPSNDDFNICQESIKNVALMFRAGVKFMADNVASGLDKPDFLRLAGLCDRLLKLLETHTKDNEDHCSFIEDIISDHIGNLIKIENGRSFVKFCCDASRRLQNDDKNAKNKVPGFLKNISSSLDKPESELYMIFTDFLQDPTFWKSEVGKSLTPILIQTVKHDLASWDKSMQNANKKAAFVLKFITDKYSSNQPLFDPSIPQVKCISFKDSDKNLKTYKKFWDYFFELYEILNETQLHIVQPVLHKLSIFNEYSNNQHVITWLPILLKKMVRHDNRTIVKEGLTRFLETGHHLRIKEQTAYRQSAQEFLDDHISVLIKDHVGWVLNDPESFISTSVKFGQFLFDLHFHKEFPQFCSAEFILLQMTGSGKCLSPHTFYFLASSLDAVLNNSTIIVSETFHGESLLMAKVETCMKLLAHVLSNSVTSVSKYFRYWLEYHCLNALLKITEQIQHLPEINLESTIFLKFLSILGSISHKTVYKCSRKDKNCQDESTSLTKIVTLYNDKADLFQKVLSSTYFVYENGLNQATVIGLIRFLDISALCSNDREKCFLESAAFVKKIVSNISNYKGSIKGLSIGLSEFYSDAIMFAKTHSTLEEIYNTSISEFMEKVTLLEKLSPSQFMSCVTNIELLQSLSELTLKPDTINALVTSFQDKSTVDDPLKMFLWKKFLLIVLKSNGKEDKVAHEFVQNVLTIDHFWNDEKKRIEVSDDECTNEIAKSYFEVFKRNLFAEYYQVKFQFYQLLFANGTSNASFETKVQLLASVLDTIEKCNPEGVAAALRLVKSVVNMDKYSVDSDAAVYMESLAKIGWSSVFELRKNEAFWSCFKAFVEFIVCPHFLQSGDLKKYSESIIENGETIVGMNFVFAKQLNGTTFPDASLEELQELHTVLLNLALAGAAVPKNNRVSFEIWDYWRNQNCDFVVDEDPENFSSDCKSRLLICEKIRLHISNLLSGVTEDERSKGTSLLEFHLTSILNLNEDESKHKKRYFGGSMTHRVKQRMYQVLLVLQPFFNMEMSHRLLHSLLESLSSDSPQPSVRYMGEWLIALIIQQYPQSYTILFDTLNECMQRRIGYGAYFSTICLQLSKTLKTEQFYDSALEKLIMLTLNQHITVRIYAQIAFQKIFEHAKDYKLQTVVDKYSPLMAPLLGALNQISGNCCKLHENISKDFYVNKFDYKSHYSYEVIFSLLPKISEVPSDECCLNKNSINNLICKPLSPNSCTTDLEKLYLEGTAWHLKAVVVDGRELSEEIPNMNNPYVLPNPATNPVVPSEEVNYQKKINPWKLLSVTEEIDEYEGLSSKKKCLSNDGLVVVASLLENLPNLGGLCRTCEIFGVSKFVVSSLKLINDQQFQNLSVSAQNWVNILEVPIRDLKSFLSTYAAKGYTILGVEQANDSSSLKHFTFPRKAVLLLGNERKGIPNELLHLVDKCIEIPQAGITRSLNVHVTGALCIWQYASQHVV